MEAPLGMCDRSTFLAQLERAGATGGCGLALLDLDHFGALNRCFGPAVAEVVLGRLAERLGACVASMAGAFATQLGGDEFAVLWPAPQAAATLARNVEALRMALRAWPADTPAVTLSVGAAIGTAGDPGCMALLSRADLALYKAKVRGRDCVVLDDDADGVGSTIRLVATPQHRC